MTVVSFVAGMLPVDFAVDGPKRERAFRLVDPVFGKMGGGDISTPVGTIAIDWSRPTERALSYFYQNTLRFYLKSELGQRIQKTCTAGRTFVDIGANLGIYSLLARLQGMSAYVIEPEPSHAEFLARNQHVFGVVLPVGLSNVTGSLPLYVNPRQPGATSLVPSEGFARSPDTVEVTTFSDLAFAGQLGQLEEIQLIKIDVEGHETETVQGLQAFLDAGFRPDIWCEVRGPRSTRAPNTFLPVSMFLEGYGYRVRNDKLDPVDVSNGEPPSTLNVFDLLFTARDDQGLLDA